MLKSSVADPDPNPDSPDPYAIGPPGYGTHFSIVTKSLISTVLRVETFFL